MTPQRAVQRGDGAMDLRPGAQNRQKREWLRREARSASVKEGSLAPFRQFFSTSPVTCPYIVGRAERKLIVELGGYGAALFYDDLFIAPLRRTHGFAYRPLC